MDRIQKKMSDSKGVKKEKHNNEFLLFHYSFVMNMRSLRRVSHIVYEKMAERNDNRRKKTMGTSREGSIFKVLQSRISKMPRPELAIKNPPTMEISVSNSCVRKGDKAPANR